MSRDLDADEMNGTFSEPSPDERERREADWLLARERGLSTAPPSAETARDYEELEHLFATLPEAKTDQSWHDEVLRKAMAVPESAMKAPDGAAPLPPSRTRRPWWRGAPLRWAAGALATASAAAAILFATVLPRTAAVAEIVMKPSKYEPDIRGIEARPSELTVQSPRGELRVFRRVPGSTKATMVARCHPGSEQCKDNGKELIFVVPIHEPGEYAAVSVDGPLNVPDNATMEEFRQAAKKQKLQPHQSGWIERK